MKLKVDRNTLIALLLVAFLAAFSISCQSGNSEDSINGSSDISDDGDSLSDSDDDSSGQNDDNERTCRIVSLEVQPSPEGNPLARQIDLKTDIPCSLSGVVSTPELAGHGASDPVSTGIETTHSLRFYGLVAESEFSFFINETAGDEVLAEGKFNTGSLPDWTPDILAVTDRASRKFNSWVAVQVSSSEPESGMALLIYDRRGRIRFFNESHAGTAKINPAGGFYFGHGELQFSSVDLYGDENLIFIPEVFEPYWNKAHHNFWMDDNLNGFFMIANELGNGLECDYFTPSLNVVGDVVVELDASGREIWRWSVFDHVDQITYTALDPDTCNLFSSFWGQGTIDWTHGNSIQKVPGEEALLLSLRNVSKVLKIDRKSGEILWQLGKQGDFIFPNGETIGFQHDAQILPNGNILLFDNHFGTYDGEWSRGLELKPDYGDMSLDIVWEYKFEYTLSHGSINKEENEDYTITNGNNKQVMIVDRDQNLLWKLELDFGYDQSPGGDIIVDAFLHRPLWE